MRNIEFLYWRKVIMKDIISQIEDIRDLNRQHKLVIFVGAGVSKNSDVCSWWELVKDIADRINYRDNCQKCKMKYIVCSECGNGLELCSYDNYNCGYKYNFSVDDYLKIPQYFYDMFGKTEYNNLLKEKFCKMLVPNEIDNLIIELNPEHIITTNYDHLLEDVKVPNRSKYKVIKNDKNLLGEYGLHYIIKMHGDIDEIENIVLKEDDYLNYSQNHILIETFIKSLLIDKTFLFIGYSLNDNNLRLIMSYIDYFAKENEIKRSMHYLTISNIPNADRNVSYWENKGIELVDLSQINDDMKKNSICSNLKNDQGQLLYSFLKYVKNDKLPYSKDRTITIKNSLLKSIKSINMFNYISYTTLLKVCNFEHLTSILNGSIHFFNELEYEILKNIFTQNDENSNKIKHAFAKSGIHSIQCNDKNSKFVYYDIEHTFFESEDDFFDLSIQNRYTDIINKLEAYPDNLEKAYYYSLIYRLNENKCQEVMKRIGEEIKSFNYNDLTYKDKYKLAVYEYNSLSIRILNFKSNDSEKWDDFIKFLDNVSEQSLAFEYIKKLCGDSGDIISKLNNYLAEHEEYYMKKSTMTKWGGTRYGNLFDLQCVVYDYYLFYKKNHLMLDWFNNVEKICEPYIKAILCTYYPDEYQYSNNSGLDRTQVEPYPLTLMDIDLIVKHTKLKKLKNWISVYKVFIIKLDEEIDIAESFDNFCISMRSFWNIYLTEQLKVFSLLISLVELTSEQKLHILRSFIQLVTPDDNIGIGMLSNSLSALWSFVQKHYDNSAEYVKLLYLLIDENLAKDPLDGKYAYENLRQHRTL